MPQRRAAHLSQIRTKSLLRHGQSTENSDVSQPLVLNAPLGVNNEGTETDSIAEDDTENKFQKPCKALNNKNSADCSTVSDGYSNLNYSQQERLKLDTNPVSSSSESDFESPAFLNRRQHRQTTCCRDKGKSLHHSAQTSNTTASKEAKAAYSSTNKKPKKESVQQRILRLHPELGTVWNHLHAIDPKTELELLQTPSDLTVSLLPFQREGVAWMINQRPHDTFYWVLSNLRTCQEEKSSFCGGILADEMGMGKTVQTIALILSRKSPERSPTLIVTPTVALLQWQVELETKSRQGALDVLVYYGGTRKRDTEFIRKHDVILTTYATIESEWRRQQSGFQRNNIRVKEPSTLHSINFFRVVLDEAHFIKDRSSNTARSVFNLKCTFKWSLSGTPLQNRVGEIYSLVRFLKADPFSLYFCKQCDCKMLDWAFSNRKNCDHCGHTYMSHFGWWNREILRPIQKHGPHDEGAVAFDRLHQLMRCKHSAIMLRRTKVDRGSELGLPPRIVHTRRDLFTQEEEDFYEALFSESKTKFQSFVRAGTVLNNYAHIFELLMRMRQSVNHPWLVTHRTGSAEDKDVCGICHEIAEDAIISACKHVFCREEIQLYLSSSCADVPVCPVCFQPLTIDLTQPTLERTSSVAYYRDRSIVRRLDFECWQSSTKIEAILEELTQLQSDTHCIKSIIFSQFTQFLDLLEWRLQRGGIRCVKLDGRMSPSNRAAVIEAFNTRPEITVFLISLKAGGLALNLTAASRVYITDPWWNPCVESQAMDRIHRLGQNRPVEVRRLIIENSIESRIDQLQEKKQLLFDSTVGMNSAALSRLTEEDLRFLFVL
eukprot:gene7540-9823_t